MSRTRRGRGGERAAVATSAAPASDAAKPGDRRRRLLLLFLLTLTTVLAAGSAGRNSVTVDEFAYLPAGMALWRQAAFHVDPGVPPLSKMLAAVPLLFTAAQAPRAPESRQEAAPIWRLGYEFQAQNRANYHRYFLVARSVSIAALVATLVLAFGLSKSLYGPAGALVSAAVVSLSPEMLAHGSLVTTDVYLAASVLGTLWAFDALVRRPSVSRAALLGVSAGVATLCKFTGLLLLPLLAASLGVMKLLERSTRLDGSQVPALSRKTVFMMTLAAVIALVVIDLGYGFDRPFTSLNGIAFQTPWLQTMQRIVPGWLPVPFPFWFVSGLDVQLSETGYDAYLLGEFNTTGFPSYYLIGWLVKTPEPILLLTLLALFARRRPSLREVPLVLTAAGSFLFFSLLGHKNIGVRYLLFLAPITAVLIGRIRAASSAKAAPSAELPGRMQLILVGWLLVVAFSAYPYYLSYFNTVSGGPLNGHRYLLDSNVDWGQGLIALRDCMRRQHIDSVDLAYFGRVDPSVYGVDSRPLVEGLPRRYAIISANLLWGRMYFVGGTTFWPSDRDYYAAFRRLEPAAVLADSLYVFDLQGQQLEAFRLRPR